MTKKKLIEVAIPLEIINAAAGREKTIRHGHPSTLHLWWARRPLATCRAVLFAQLVDDPSSHPDKFSTEESLETERKRLFGIIEDLVKWENSTNEEVLERARVEIRNSCEGELPPVYDPFSGGGSIPLEAQRLGLPAYGSDLNPVAVMIGKAMIEVPGRFKDLDPIHPGIKERNHYRNAEGLAEDLKYYGELIKEKAWDDLGHLYPYVELPNEAGGAKATVIAWIWARTVPSPDPAFSDVQVPLISNFVLRAKEGNEVWIEASVDKIGKVITYAIRKGGTKSEIDAASLGTSAGKRKAFRCIMSDAAITYPYIRECGQNGEMGQELIAIVTEGKSGRIYVAPSNTHREAAKNALPSWQPEINLPTNPRDFKTPNYGIKTFGELFTARQLVALDKFCDLVSEVRKQVRLDAENAGRKTGIALSAGGIDASAYADTISIFLAFAISKMTDYHSSITSWNQNREIIRNAFGRQALPMTWDFSEANPFSNSTGNWGNCVAWGVKTLEHLVPAASGQITQHDAQSVEYPKLSVISTDPPYYDNIGYADLSDYFYVWMRRTLRDIYPDLFSVLTTPKSEELVATPYRHGSKDLAEQFFLDGMRRAIKQMSLYGSQEIPAVIYYAFKQSEISQEGTSSTGWATFLQAVIEAGYVIVGTWPMRTEMSNRLIASGTNALANSVVIVCRQKNENAETITRSQFVRELKSVMPTAISGLKLANVSPADMPQSAIGPGIGVYSRYHAVLEPDDSHMSVKKALQLINAVMDEYLNDLHGEFDAETRFAASWFEQNGYENGDFGVANNLATARGISVESVKHAGIIESSAGKVRILKRKELDPDWDPNTDASLTVWECCQYLVRAHDEGEYAAALLIRKLGFDKAEAVKDLAYYLYDVCSQKRQDAEEATAYNGLIAVWSDLTRLAATIQDTDMNRQSTMDI